MTKDEIVEYVMHTPHNSNPRVLRDLLDELPSSSGSGGNANVIIIENDEFDYEELRGTVPITNEDEELVYKTIESYELSETAAQKIYPYLASNIDTYIIYYNTAILINNNSINNSSLLPVSQGWYVLDSSLNPLSSDIMYYLYTYNLTEMDKSALAEEYGKYGALIK